MATHVMTYMKEDGKRRCIPLKPEFTSLESIPEGKMAELRAKGLFGFEVYEVPTEQELEEWFLDGVVEALDGCRVEPDGVCPHGYPSWFIALGYL